MIKKLASGRWRVDVQPGGRGHKRYRKAFDTRAEANRFERWAMAQKPAELVPVLKRDNRTLSDLIDAWYDQFGHTLKDGARRKTKLKAMAEKLGDPVAQRFTASAFATYRRLRIENDGVSENTVNHEHSYLGTVFNELSRIGEWQYGNPLKDLRKFKLDEQELAFLDSEQIERLLEECQASTNPSLYHVVRLALATGARWSEARDVKRSQLSPYRVTYNYTKSGKSRSVPIAKELYEELVSNLPFTCSMGAFRRAIERAKIDLPKGQLTHVCRHTFASHFVMNGGDILTLQKVLGHSDIKLTMRYAHLSPEHMNEVVRLSPVH